MKIKIERCKVDDAEQYINFLNLVWKNAYSNIFPEEVFQRRDHGKQNFINGFERFLNDKNNFYICAKIDNNIIGILFGNLKTHNMKYQNLGFAELGAIYVHPDFQRQGIGKQLKNYFEKWLKENGKDKYVIGVLQRNKNAIKTYESWGGKNMGRIFKTEIMGKKYNEIIFEFRV